MRFTLRWALPLAAFIVLGAWLVSREPRGNDKQPDELLVGILVDPIFYQPGSAASEPGGFELEALQAFAESRQKRLRLVPAANPGALVELLADGDRNGIDFIASTPIRAGMNIRYSIPLREERPLVVQHADSVPLGGTDSLAHRTVEVLPGTLQEAALQELAASAPVSIDRPLVASEIDLLGRIANRQAQLAATDTAHFDVAVNFFPDLVVALELPGKVEYAWGFRPEDEDLRKAADAFIVDFRRSGRLARLHDRYFGHIKRINPIAAMRFIEDTRRVLPRFRSMFERAASMVGMDWRLLAALAYQESKWDPLATSYTNVRGIMMLTEETADRLGVGNRLDAAESILAGARYLAELAGRLPDEVPEPDRLWMALAAYNLGYGHLNGARQIAVGMKRDPTSWYDMKKVLPLMSQPEYYERLKSGPARGGEAVILVENVRTYYDILRRHQPARLSPLQTGLAMQQ